MCDTLDRLVAACLGQGGRVETNGRPLVEHGEPANTTNLITSVHRFEPLGLGTSGEPVKERALVIGGLDSLVLKMAAIAVHAAFFESMSPAVCRSAASGVDAELSRALGGTLSSAPVNDRTDDDKTLVLASRRRA